jgi:hypothetical protein
MANKYAKESVKETVTKKTTKLGLGPTRTCNWSRRKQKQESGKRLAEERAGRNDREQLDHLDSILGKGKGAVKERAKLNARLAAGNKPTSQK